MALTDASDSKYVWGPPYKDEAKLANTVTLQEQWNNVNGFSETRNIYYDNFFETPLEYPALFAIENYNSRYASSSLWTGWFIPSSGQWWSIIEGLGGIDLGNIMAGNGKTYNLKDGSFIEANGNVVGGNSMGYVLISGHIVEEIIDNINAKLALASGKVIERNTGFWTSSEANDVGACCIYYYYEVTGEYHALLLTSGSIKNNECLVRTIFAF